VSASASASTTAASAAIPSISAPSQLNAPTASGAPGASGSTGATPRTGAPASDSRSVGPGRFDTMAWKNAGPYTVCANQRRTGSGTARSRSAMTNRDASARVGVRSRSAARRI